ncbi:tRNA (guanine-N(7)-)-methyltransferase [Longimycelium tulufanense]|uniref:tRNA (guanine-N(7)-)-methyltransferase n=1 Tax=Longimycelium tulufanense TaxID=907463 RepID=A0A8J3CFC7_9PSEU|nr:tRNA (guanosine(46)-N7)-methyltransferase TrmB [Longimycelium tulufanense]GGM67288.1 tRNA (guanine-N(7)-)-methyltransferase [Longimycelium tulufanense]
METPSGQQPFLRTVVSYVQRGERMTTGQQRAWDQYWNDLGNEVSALPEGPLDTDAWFGRTAPVLLEIGSGMGEATAQLAAAAPELNYLAVEVYKPGLAQLLLRGEKLGLTNLRLLRGDAIDLLEEHIAPGSLAGIRIFFPDPWPKKRHHKRRLVQPKFVALAASRLAPGADLHLATDWEHYAEQMRAVCEAEPLLRNRYADRPGGWAPRPEWRPVTKFENRAHAEGRVSHDLVFGRVPVDKNGGMSDTLRG